MGDPFLIKKHPIKKIKKSEKRFNAKIKRLAREKYPNDPFGATKIMDDLLLKKIKTKKSPKNSGNHPLFTEKSFE